MTTNEYKIAQKVLKNLDPNMNLIETVKVLEKLKEMLLNIAIEEELKKHKEN